VYINTQNAFQLQQCLCESITILCYKNTAYLVSALSQSVHTVLLATRTLQTLAMYSAFAADLLCLISLKTDCVQLFFYWGGNKECRFIFFTNLMRKKGPKKGKLTTEYQFKHCGWQFRVTAMPPTLVVRQEFRTMSAATQCDRRSMGSKPKMTGHKLSGVNSQRALNQRHRTRTTRTWKQ
jgi:hypothetical protein